MGWFEELFPWLNPVNYAEQTANLAGLVIIGIFLGVISLLILTNKIPIGNMILKWLMGLGFLGISIAILLGWFW